MKHFIAGIVGLFLLVPSVLWGISAYDAMWGKFANISDWGDVLACLFLVVALLVFPLAAIIGIETWDN